MSERFCDVGRGITLCYETFGSEDDVPLLLIMGLATQMIGWPEDFCRALADRGFYVVRFDNRDSGRSTRIDGSPPSLAQLVARRVNPVLYTVADMAADANGLMRSLGIAPAHVMGASMGGMIAQTLAARHPDAVRSLVSIMSNTGSRWRGQPQLGVLRYLIGRAPEDRAGYIERMLRVFAAIGSQGLPRDEARLREVAGRSYDRGHSAAGAGRQLGAIVASGDRTPELRAITAPTLVIHGTTDRLVAPSGGSATAQAIPGARLLKITGMGHDLPEAAWSQLLDAIAAHLHAADEVEQAA
jgi:pimeloyl-ACP methyl ester carboxylesterase